MMKMELKSKKVVTIVLSVRHFLDSPSLQSHCKGGNMAQRGNSSIIRDNLFWLSLYLFFADSQFYFVDSPIPGCFGFALIPNLWLR